MVWADQTSANAAYDGSCESHSHSSITAYAAPSLPLLCCQDIVCADQDPKALLDVSAEEDFHAKLQEADFGSATSALTILRYQHLRSSPPTLRPQSM